MFLLITLDRSRKVYTVIEVVYFKLKFKIYYFKTSGFCGTVLNKLLFSC